MLPLLFVSLAVLIVERGYRAALVLATSFLVVAALTIAVVYGRPPADVVAQTIGIVLFLGYGVLMGQVLREATTARRENERLLAELRASVETEKDLALTSERTRAAAALHDGLGHQLTAIRMSLDIALARWDAQPQVAHAEVRRAGDLSTMALDRMRTWSRALDPVSVGALTDVAAFEAIADSFRDTGLEVVVETAGESRPLARDQALFCLRVVQEGLTNALRHGGAGRAHIRVAHDRRELTLTCSDDGEPPEGSAEVVEGFGLRSLRERAEGLGGTVRAGWSVDGFRLCATLPLPGDARGARTGCGASAAGIAS